MATLYLARRHGASGFVRQVALKVIHPHLLEQPKFVEMFVDEARICAEISHPNIVHVEELGEVGGLHFLVMEYIDGCSVNELLQFLRATNRKLDPEIAAHIVMHVARGLHAAHEAVDSEGVPLEIIHRDITPSNILLSAEGAVKLIDFGIAKARNRIAETESGFALKGKYRYIAPEQATRSVDRRGDIFSLGVVLWELLTAEHLFADDTHVGLFNRLQETPARIPSDVNPDSPVVLDPIVMAMLQHEPGARPETAIEVHRRIAAAMPGAIAVDTTALGKLTAEVRDARRSSRAGTEDRFGTEPSFSPSRRSKTHEAAVVPDEYRVEITRETPPPPNAAAPSRRKGSRPAIFLTIGLAVVLLLWLAFRDRGTQSSATVATIPALPAPTPTPPAPTTPTVLAAPPSPIEPRGSAAPAAATAVAPPVAIAPPTAPVRVDARVPPVPQPRAQPARPLVKSPNSITVQTAPEEVKRPPAKKATFRAGKATFVDGSFDDAGNSTTTTTTTTTPGHTKVKKTTIVTDFGN